VISAGALLGEPRNHFSRSWPGLQTAGECIFHDSTRDQIGHGFTWSLSLFRYPGPGVIEVESSREPSYVCTQIVLNGDFDTELFCGATYSGRHGEDQLSGRFQFLLPAILGLGLIAAVIFAIVMKEEMNPYFEERFATALQAQSAGGADISALRTIFSQEVPRASLIERLEEQIDSEYGYFPSPDGRYDNHWTMLGLAFRWRNLEAAEALMKAGADPDTGGYEAVTTRVFSETGATEWSYSEAATRLYLEYGGSPGYTSETAPYPLLSSALGNGNYPAAWILLEAGADPFETVRGYQSTERGPGVKYRYPVTSLISPVADQLKFLIELQAGGYIDDAPANALPFFYDDWSDVITQMSHERSASVAEERMLLHRFLTESLEREIDHDRGPRERAIAALAQQIAEQD